MDNQQLPIAAAAAGDQEAFRLILHRMEPLIQAQIHTCRCDGTEDEDLAQEALMGLLAAVRTYRPEVGAAFTTYATACIRNRLLSAARRVGKIQREVPLEEDAELSDDAADPALRLQEQEDAQRLLGLMRQRLTDLEYTVMLLRLSECSYDEIAARLGITKKAVDNAVQRLRRKIRQ